MKIRRFPRRIRPAAALAAFIVALLAPSARAVIIGGDDFDYADGPLAGKNGGFFWNWRNRTPAARTTAGASDWDNVTGAPAVISGRLVTAGTSAVREYNGPGEGTSVDINRDDGLGAINNFSSGDIAFQEHVVYYRVTFTTGAALPAAIGVSAYDFGTERVFFGKTFNNPVFGIGRSDGIVDSSNVSVLPNTTYVLVAKLDYLTGKASLFINPDLGAAAEPVPAVSMDFPTANWTTAVRLASDGAPSVIWDDLTVCTKWSDLAPVVVNTDADADNGFLGGGSGISLREAVKYAPAGSRITFAPGLSGKTITLTHSDGDMAVPDTLTIDAASLPGGLTVDGINTSRHFFLDTGKSLTLRGLTLTGGNGVGGTTFLGGSILNYGTLRLDRCTFTANVCDKMGGAVFTQGTLRAADCTFSDSTVTGEGGGIYLQKGSMDLTRCTFSGNTARGGGGVFVLETSGTTLDHCTFFNNRATGADATGGVVAQTGTVTLRHCTVTQNIGKGGGGGVFLQSPANVNLDSCLIAGNTDSGGGPADIKFSGGTLNTTGKNLIGSNQTVEAKFPAGPLAGTAAAPLDPKLDLAGFHGGLTKNFALLSGSPARDAATGSTATADQRGFPMLGTPDLGAFEAQFGSVPDLTVAAGTATIEFTITVGQAGTLSAVSSNTGLVPSGNITFSGSGGTRTVTITPVANQTGTTGLTIFGSSGDVLSFALTIADATPPDLVVTSAADAGPGSLREKIAACAAHPGSDVITFAPGFTGPILLSSQLTVADASGSVTIDAGTVTGGLTLDAQNTSRHFSIDADSAILLRGLTLIRGNSSVSGHGGSINNQGKLLLERCTFTGNKVSFAGGSGGAVANIGSDADLDAEDCTFMQNTANGRGGGIFVGDGGIILTRCTLSGNAADRAGAVWLEAATSAAGLDRCTISGNKGTGVNAGGGIGCLQGTLKMKRCTITQNTGTSGGGLHVANNTEARFQYCLIAGNSDAGGGGADIRFSGGTVDGLDENLIGNNQSVEAEFPAGPLTGTAAAPLDPKLDLPGLHGGLTKNFPLLPGSPARDAATSAAATANDTDQRGFPIVGTPDLGAFEVQFGPVQNVTVEAGTATVPVPLTVGNVGTLQAGSSNAALVPAGNISFSGSGASRTVTLAPAANQSGSTIITILGELGDTAAFTLTVNPSFTVPPATFSRTLTAGMESMKVDFTLHPIRSEHFKVFVQQADGSFTTFTPGAPRTYIGAVPSRPGAVAAGFLRADGTLWAFVALEDGRLWRTVGGAVETFGNDTTPAWPTSTAPAGGAGSAVYAAEVGIDSSFSHFIACGGTPPDVVEKNEFCVMCANVIFLRDCAILHRIGSIVIRANQAKDPYAGDGGDTGKLLDHVKAFWNTGNPMGSTHDLALVAQFPANGGLASLNSVGTDSGYSSNNSDDWGDYTQYWRHEAGHNWGSDHFEGGGNPEGDTIMSNNNLARFSSAEARKIIAGRDRAAASLDNLGPYSFALPPRANQDAVFRAADGTARVDVLANDADSNGQALTLLSMDPASARGGTLTRSAGTGPGGRDEVKYTPPASIGKADDWFRYRIQDSAGNQAVGYVVLGPPVTAYTVTSAADAGTGSLRAILAAADADSGPALVTFASGLTGPIVLNTEITVADPMGVTIDASGRPAGITLDGHKTCRLFRIVSGVPAAFNRLQFLNGNGKGGGEPADYGGAIFSEGHLRLTDCTLSGNAVANVAGAIFSQNPGSLTMERCTLDNNTAGNAGGAIQHESVEPLTATYCTFTKNQAVWEGGAISAPFGRPVRLIHCTVSGNRLTGPTGTGGGMLGAALTLSDSIVTGNTAPNTPDLPAGFTSLGTNLTGAAANPGPAALADNGGLTKTMALPAGSPALNAATFTGSPAPVSDQRGFPIVGQPDIGAYEAGTPPPADDFASFIKAALPSTATEAQRAPDYDYDGDGQTNQAEWITGTQPADPGSVYQPAFSATLNTFIVIYATVPGRTYTLQQSDTLAPNSWTNALTGPLMTVTGDGQIHTWNFSRPPAVANVPRRFYRVLVTR